MGEPRIFVPAGQIEGDLVHLSPEVLRHLRRVLRLQAGDLLRATDGAGRELLVRLEAVEEQLQGRIVERSHPATESPLAATLVQALPKKDLMEQVLQKAVELGVSAIQPVVTGRTVAVMRAGRGGARRQRWQRIIEAAVAQSGRTTLPRLGEVMTWEQFLARVPGGGLKILLREREGRHLGEIVSSRPGAARIVLAVGPEGGWEEREVRAALGAGFEVAGLGPRILRTETAGVAALALLQFLCGDLGAGGEARLRDRKYDTLPPA